MEECFKKKGVKMVMPEKGKNDTLMFTNYSKQSKVPYTIYADFEALLLKQNENGVREIKNIHEISGYCLTVNSPYQEDHIEDYRGEHAGEYFISNLRRLSRELKQKIGEANADMIYGPEELEKFQKATHCHICGDGIKSPKIDHLKKIAKLLKIVGLPNRYPSQNDVKKKIYFKILKISEDEFTRSKQELIA